MLLEHRLDRRSLGRLAGAEPLHGAEGSPNALGDQFARDAPFEDLADAGDGPVDPLASDPGLDEFVAASHEGEGTEVGHRRPAVELREGPDSDAVIAGGASGHFQTQPTLGVSPILVGS